MLCLGFVGAVLHAALLLAADPTAVIVGPSQALPGDLIVLDGGSSQATGFAWVLADSDKSFLPVDGGRRLVFATGTPGKYTFILVTALAGGDANPRVALARHVVVVGDDPTPPVPPGPDPLPPGRFNLAAQARDWTTLVKLPAVDRRRTAELVAGSFESVASAIAAGAMTKVGDALAKLVAANQSALSPSEYAAWKADWNPKFQSAMTQLDDAGKLPALADVAAAFLEIAQGLRAVR
jgi:hypothetical protein